jgi:general secretion pathway protein K
MVRGVGDDFWATFFEDESGDPRKRKVTIYGSGAVNVNMAPPEVLLARLCSYVADQPLCQQPGQQLAFVQLLNTVHSFLPIPLFSNEQEFFNLITRKPSGGKFDLVTLLPLVVPGGNESPLLAWTPLLIPDELQKKLAGMFLTEASIFSMQSTGTVGRTQVKVTMVVNTDRTWVPPKGVAATMPSLGVVHYYRVD